MESAQSISNKGAGINMPPGCTKVAWDCYLAAKNAAENLLKPNIEGSDDTPYKLPCIQISVQKAERKILECLGLTLLDDGLRVYLSKA
jgi:hypothetical protein